MPILGAAQEGNPIPFGRPHRPAVGAVGQGDAVDAVGVAEQQAVAAGFGKDNPLPVRRPVSDDLLRRVEGEAGSDAVGQVHHIEVGFVGAGRAVGDAGPVRGPHRRLPGVNAGHQLGYFPGGCVVCHQPRRFAGLVPHQGMMPRRPAGEARRPAFVGYRRRPIAPRRRHPDPGDGAVVIIIVGIAAAVIAGAAAGVPAGIAIGYDVCHRRQVAAAEHPAGEAARQRRQQHRQHHNRRGQREREPEPPPPWRRAPRADLQFHSKASSRRRALCRAGRRRLL